MHCLFLHFVKPYLLQQIIHPNRNRSRFVSFAGIVRTTVAIFFCGISTGNLKNTHIGVV